MSWFLTKAAFIWPGLYISYALVRPTDARDIFYIFRFDSNIFQNIELEILRLVFNSEIFFDLFFTSCY